MLKVCHLTSVHQRYDIRIFKKECCSLARAGFDVSLVVADGLEDEEVDKVKIFGVPKEASRIKRFIKATKNVYTKALEIDADIYHFHDAELLPSGNKLRRMGRVVIYDSHEDLPRQLLSKPYLSKFMGKVVAQLLEKYEDNSCKKYDAVVTATPFINERFLKVNPTSVNVNNYPLSDEFNSGEVSVGPESNNVCFVGGITEIRGVEYIVRAMTDVDAKLQLAGGINPDSYKEKLVSDPGWSKVEYHGHVSREGVRDILHKSAAGIVTYLPYPNHINAQPNKLFEYMSAGIAVIASRFPLWQNIVEKYECGICVDPENSTEIAEAISFLIANPEKAQTMGSKGRKAVEEVFNWEQESEKLLKLYKSLL